MITNPQELKNALLRVSEFTPLMIGETRNEFEKNQEAFINELNGDNYIKVPLVGIFSAGKSSLLNVFTQKPNMLPVDTAPETAVAYELHYGIGECIELYREGKLIEEKKLNDIAQLATKPGDIAMVYCKSDPIRALQEKGIILVDMPGIGSGIERHDAAIFNYINRGSSFILLVDAEQGSLRSSTLTFMEELSQYNLHPAVLVSKIDKKPEADVNDIVEYIKFQLKKLGDENPYVDTVCAVNGKLDGLTNYLDSLDANAMVVEKMGGKLKKIIDAIMEQFKLRVETRSKDIANLDGKIKEVEDEITNVKAELPTNNANLDTPEKSTRDILEQVKEALIAKSTDIAQMIVDKEDNEVIKATIVSIVRSQVINSLREESEQYTSTLGDAVQEAVQHLATIEVDTGFIEDFNEIIEAFLPYIELLINAGGIWGRIAQVLLPFLPDLLNWLFGKSDEEILEEVRQKVIHKCANQVTTGLEPTIFKIVAENQQRIKTKMQEELVSKMEKVKDSLREKMEDINKSKEDIDAEISHLNYAIDQLQSIKESI